VTVLHRVPHPVPLIEGRFLARWDRFIAEIALTDGTVVRAHCVNPGRMEGLLVPDSRVWLTPAPEGSKRKLRYTWTLLENHGALMGVDTTAPNRIIESALRARALPGFRRWRTLEREVKQPDGSRIDFVLGGARPRLLEVKNCNVLYPDRRIYFPDTVSERATRHVEHLAEVVREGGRATVLFVVQRSEALRAVRPSRLHDPTLAAACAVAAEAGVRFRAFQVRPTLQAYEITRSLRVDLGSYDPERLRPWREEGLLHGGWRRSKKPKSKS